MLSLSGAGQLPPILIQITENKIHSAVRAMNIAKLGDADRLFVHRKFMVCLLDFRH